MLSTIDFKLAIIDLDNTLYAARNRGQEKSGTVYLFKIIMLNF